MTLPALDLAFDLADVPDLDLARAYGEVTTNDLGIDLFALHSGIDGLAVVVIPRSGETFAVNGRMRNLLTDGQLRSATGSHFLERSFVDGAAIDVVVERATGDEVVPNPSLVDLRGSVLLSPNGRWVFVAGRDGAGSALYDTLTGTVLIAMG